VSFSSANNGKRGELHSRLEGFASLKDACFSFIPSGAREPFRDQSLFRKPGRRQQAPKVSDMALRERQNFGANGVWLRPGYSIKFERVKEREPDSRVPSLWSGYLKDG